MPKCKRTMSNICRTTKPLRLRNVICPYCGVGLSKGNSTKEHVLGLLQFVPKAVLSNQWNLIFTRAGNLYN